MPKISELNVTANVATSDLLVVVKDPSGAPSTNKITAGNFMTHASRFMPYANTTAVGGIKVGSDFSVNSTGYLLFSSSQLPTANQSEGYLLTWDAVTNSAIWQTFSGVYPFKTIDGANTYSVEEHDGVLFADCNVVGENIVIVLPDAGSNPEAVIGKTYSIKNIDPGDGFVARVTTYSAQLENNANLENPITGEFVTSFDIPNKGDEHEWIYDGGYWRHKGSQSYLPFYSASANTFTQIVLQNRSSGTNASGDVVVYSDAGDPNAGTGPFVDLGINSSQYSNAVYSIGGPNDAYLFNDGGDFAIGTGSVSSNLIFHTGGTTSNTVKMKISSDRVDINVNNFTFSGIAGPFANDTAAATGGVLLKGFYYDASGNVKIRLI